MLKYYRPETSNINSKAKIGEDCTLHSHIWIGEAVIGERCRIQAFTFIPDGVVLEDDVFVGPRVTFTNDRDIALKGKTHWQKTLVKQHAKIGAGAIIVAGVTIGESAVIGAGAVVTKNVPSGETWVGNPAEPLWTDKTKSRYVFYCEQTYKLV